MVRKAVLALVWTVSMAALAAAPEGTTGADRPQVAVNVSTFKEVAVQDAEGRRHVELRPASLAGPGDTLVYRIAFTNTGRAPALGARVQDPIPAGTHLVPGSCRAIGAALTVSVDGGLTFQAYPVVRTVTRPDGGTERREVEPTAYTHLRWIAEDPMAPGQTREAEFKVIVR